jgi:FkbM family methyltransferase
MSNFNIELTKTLLFNSGNNFSYDDNYDMVRFGNVDSAAVSFKGKIRKLLVKDLNRRGYTVVQKDRHFNENVAQRLDALQHYLPGLETFYNILSDDKSRELLLQVLAFRILGFTKVKLPLNTPDFWKGLREMEQIADEKKYIEANFLNWHLPFVDLNKMGIPVQFYFLPMGAFIDFIVKQYAFDNGTRKIMATQGDYVIDAGGCWGDTALYFANEVGAKGRVFTYEFIPSNLAIMRQNLALNPALQQRITVVQRPVWEKSEETMYYIDAGPGSRVFMQEEKTYDGKVESLSIDQLVREQNIPKVDFIKMDIEGAEPYALRGAVETIKKFSPKLAIAIYHSMDDFINIPKFIHELGLNYQLYFAHCSIHEEETILFAEIPAQ